MRALLSILLLLSSWPCFADKHPAGFSNHIYNGSHQPMTKAGITTFQIFDRQCSTRDYGDGRGENDCHNGNVRSALLGPDKRLGHAIEYRFEVWVDPSLSYRGFYNDHALGFLPGAHDSRLRIASWEGNLLHNFLFMLKLDEVDGITFLGKQCQSPKHFGKWVKFSLKVRWAKDQRGWIQVRCDDNVIYSAEGAATNQAPHCFITNQCEPGVPKNPRMFTFLLGPVMAGFGPEWKMYGQPSQFTPIQPEGVTIKMRNISVTPIVKP